MLFFQRVGSAILAQCPGSHAPTNPWHPNNLNWLLGKPRSFLWRPPKHDLDACSVTDDWPEQIPITKAEVNVFKAWFGDLINELLGPCQ